MAIEIDGIHIEEEFDVMMALRQAFLLGEDDSPIACTVREVVREGAKLNE